MKILTGIQSTDLNETRLYRCEKRMFIRHSTKNLSIKAAAKVTFRFPVLCFSLPEKRNVCALSIFDSFICAMLAAVLVPLGGRNDRRISTKIEYV